MRLLAGRLTQQESTFAAEFAKTGDRTYAAGKAGYKHPVKMASQALQVPKIQEEIRRQQLAILNNDLLPAAIGVLGTILADEKASATSRLQAVKIVLDRSLGDKETTSHKEPHEMSADEIQRQLDTLRREAANRARVVIEHEPTDRPIGDGSAFE